ncbi:MAG TPA: hypothetical protein VFT82_03690 [Candidatus Paceibacterota bacterium]|nr:hypothetical protein [Candidatus Paceibacterota bacterium]
MKTLERAEFRPIPVRNLNNDLVFCGEAFVKLDEGFPVVAFYGARGGCFKVRFSIIGSFNLDDILGADLSVEGDKIVITLIGASYRDVRMMRFIEASEAMVVLK